MLPFADWRVSFDSINIVNPVNTISLIVGTGISLFMYPKESTKRYLPNQMGLLVSTLYLMFILSNKQHVQNVFAENLQEQKMPYYKMLSVLVKIVNLSW